VVLTTELAEPVMQSLLDFCRAQNIPVDLAGMAVNRILAATESPSSDR